MAKNKKNNNPSGIDKKEMAANYGWALSVLKSNRELWRLFNRAVKKNYSVNRFVAELRNTGWFKHHSDSWRQTRVLQKTDPKTYKQRRTQMRSKVWDMAAQLGADISKGMANRIAGNALWLGWDDSLLRNALASHVEQMGKSGHYGGEAGQAEQELRQYATSMGIRIGDSTLKKWLRNIVSQGQTTDDYKAWLQGHAENLFPELKQQIKEGMTVRDIADPYFQSMGNILEVDSSALDLFDPTIRKALSSYKDEATGKVGVKLIWQFETDLRKDPRWLETNNARESLMQSTHQMLQDFGFRF